MVQRPPAFVTTTLPAPTPASASSAACTCAAVASKARCPVVPRPATVRVKRPSTAPSTVTTWTRLGFGEPPVMPRPAIVVPVTTPIRPAAVAASSTYSVSVSAPPVMLSGAAMPTRLPPVPVSVEEMRTVSSPAPVATEVTPETLRTMTASAPLLVVSAVVPVCVEWTVKVSPPEPRSMVRASNAV
jgi:hypothetical protein